MNVSLTDAWDLWGSGKLSPSDRLWGLSILWWGRLGRIAEFVGALTIVAEIIGPKRIQAFGSSLRERSIRAVKSTDLQDPVGWLREKIKYLRAESGSEEEKQAQKKAEAYATDNLYIFVALGFIAAGGLVAWQLTDSAGWILPGIFVGSAAGGLVGPFVAFGLAVIVRARGILFDTVLFAPIGWALNRSSIDVWIKAAALALLLVGFHFDLLAP